jgi:hypothetical protein
MLIEVYIGIADNVVLINVCHPERGEADSSKLSRQFVCDSIYRRLQGLSG